MLLTWQLVIDKQKLLAYCDGDEQLASNLLIMFGKEAQEALDVIPRYLAGQQWDALAITVHKIKSHCRYLGAEEMAHLAGTIEKRCDAGAVSGLDLDVEVFMQRLKELVQSQSDATTNW